MDVLKDCVAIANVNGSGRNGEGRPICLTVYEELGVEIHSSDRNTPDCTAGPVCVGPPLPLQAPQELHHELTRRRAAASHQPAIVGDRRASFVDTTAIAA